LPLIVAPVTRSPGFFAPEGSPVIMDSSTFDEPSRQTASTGIFSPGRTRSLSPTCTSPSGTSTSRPSDSMRSAVFGASASSLRIAWLVSPMARSCMTSPSITSVTITAAASK
jgi:hypothetical protein